MANNVFIFTLFFINAGLIHFVFAQTANSNDNSINSTATTSVPTTTQQNKNISCESFNNDCKACIAKSECYYCSEKNICHLHLESLVSDSKCNIKDVYYLTCKMSLKTMMILIGVFSGIVVFMVVIICCYCCCKKKSTKLSKDDLKWARQKEERQQIAAERRKERSERNEEIRKKWLVRDSNPYQKFDD